jgi:phosphinothricin acetyltransferase
MMIRPVKIEDASSIRTLYNYYIENTVITFEEIPVSVEEMESRIKKVSAKYPWFVWEESGEILGYAYVNTWKERAAYRYSVEDSIYLKNGCLGKGIGRSLFARLLEEVRKTEIHTIVAGITVPNDQSTGLHEKFGFKKIAHFNEVGFKQNRWLDVGFWELILK